MKEIFKDIKNYEGLYKVSNLGAVKSLITNKVLKQENAKSGDTTYKRVCLFKNGKGKRYLVHRLVAFHFISNPENKPQVNHIDNNTHNNTDTNLEWCTASENMKHSRDQGRQDKVTKLAAEAMAKANLAKSKLKYDAIIGTNINGRILQSYERCGRYYRGVFICENCGRTFNAGLDSSLRNINRVAPTYCRGCVIRINKNKLEDIV